MSLLARSLYRCFPLPHTRRSGVLCGRDNLLHVHNSCEIPPRICARNYEIQYFIKINDSIKYIWSALMQFLPECSFLQPLWVSMLWLLSTLLNDYNETINFRTSCLKSKPSNRYLASSIEPSCFPFELFWWFNFCYSDPDNFNQVETLIHSFFSYFSFIPFS